MGMGMGMGMGMENGHGHGGALSWGLLRRDLALRGASGEAAGRSMCPLTLTLIVFRQRVARLARRDNVALGQGEATRVEMIRQPRERLGSTTGR